MSSDSYRPPAETWKDRLLKLGMFVGAVAVFPLLVAWHALPNLRLRRLRSRGFGPIGRSSREGPLWIGFLVCPPFTPRELDPRTVVKASWTVVRSDWDESDILDLELEGGERVALESEPGRRDAISDLVDELTKRGVLDPSKRRHVTEFGVDTSWALTVIWLAILFFLVLWLA